MVPAPEQQNPIQNPYPFPASPSLPPRRPTSLICPSSISSASSESTSQTCVPLFLLPRAFCPAAGEWEEDEVREKLLLLMLL